LFKQVTSNSFDTDQPNIIQTHLYQRYSLLLMVKCIMSTSVLLPNTAIDFRYLFTRLDVKH